MEDIVPGVGIDAEINEPLPPGVLDIIANPSEVDWLRTRHQGGIHWDKVIFSAKESLFKAAFPATSEWLTFADASISIDPNVMKFEVEFSRKFGPKSRLSDLRFVGRVLVSQAYIYTSVVLQRVESTEELLEQPNIVHI
jgi:4'-phosphopantetheinyl transferase EntD